WVQQKAPQLAIGCVGLMAISHLVLGHSRQGVALFFIAMAWTLVWRSPWRISVAIYRELRLPLLWLTLFLGVGEAIWFLPEHCPHACSHEAYAEWPIYPGVFPLTAIARWVDKLPIAHPSVHVRPIAVAAVLALSVGLLRPITVGTTNHRRTPD